MQKEAGTALDNFEQCRLEAQEWLLAYAAPLWFGDGIDSVQGGSYDKIGPSINIVKDKKRTRVHARHIFSYALSEELGWRGFDYDILRKMTQDLLNLYRRPDGLFYYSLSDGMEPLDKKASLYEQAFALTALAKAYKTTRDIAYRIAAHDTMSAIIKLLQIENHSFLESCDDSSGQTILANSHMHLFEAMIAWMEIDETVIWQKTANTILTLCSTKFYDSSNKGVYEFFEVDLTRRSNANVIFFEPGHLFEWAWLIHKYCKLTNIDHYDKLVRGLCKKAYEDGYDSKREYVINKIDPNGNVIDASARFWPQTEAIKALLIMTDIFPHNKDQYLIDVVTAWRSLQTYFHKDVQGLWYDIHNEDGSFVKEAAPASSLYHVIGAICEMANYNIRTH